MLSDGTTPMRVCTSCGRSLPLSPEFFQVVSVRGAMRHRCEDCRREASRVYYASHRAEVRENQRVYRLHNSERLLARQYELRAHDRPKYLAVRRAWYAANRGRECARNLGYAAEHREEARRRAAQWVRQHPEDHLAHSRNRKARILGNGGTHTAADVRSQYGRQRGRCYWCGKKVPWGKKHVDHVVPLALGGSNGPENLVVSCVRCNARKGAKHPMDFAGRML